MSEKIEKMEKKGAVVKMVDGINKKRKKERINKRINKRKRNKSSKMDDESERKTISPVNELPDSQNKESRGKLRERNCVPRECDRPS